MFRGWPKSLFRRDAARSRAHAGGYSHRNRSQFVIRLACGCVMPFAYCNGQNATTGVVLHERCILGGREALQDTEGRPLVQT